MPTQDATMSLSLRYARMLSLANPGHTYRAYRHTDGSCRVHRNETRYTAMLPGSIDLTEIGAYRDGVEVDENPDDFVRRSAIAADKS